MLYVIISHADPPKPDSDQDSDESGSNRQRLPWYLRPARKPKKTEKRTVPVYDWLNGMSYEDITINVPQQPEPLASMYNRGIDRFIGNDADGLNWGKPALHPYVPKVLPVRAAPVPVRVRVTAPVPVPVRVRVTAPVPVPVRVPPPVRVRVTAPVRVPAPVPVPVRVSAPVPVPVPNPNPTREELIEEARRLRIQRDEEREDLLGIQSDRYFDREYCYTYDTK